MSGDETNLINTVSVYFNFVKKFLFLTVFFSIKFFLSKEKLVKSKNKLKK